MFRGRSPRRPPLVFRGGSECLCFLIPATRHAKMLNVNPTLSSKMSGTMTFSERKKFIDLKGLLFSLLLTLLASLGLSQQTETASISGRINDPSGIAVPGAKVSLLREGETVPVATATTGPNGGYTLSQVLPGKYFLSAENAGVLKSNPPDIDGAPRKDVAAEPQNA